MLSSSTVPVLSSRTVFKSWIWIRFRHPEGRSCINIHLTGSLPGGSPADHPDEVVVDMFPLQTRPGYLGNANAKVLLGQTVECAVTPKPTIPGPL